MPPDDVDRILNRLDKFEEKLEPALTLIAVHTKQIETAEKEIGEYKKEQVPKCDRKFDKLFSLVWWILGIFLIATLGLTGTLIAKMVKP